MCVMYIKNTSNRENSTICIFFLQITIPSTGKSRRFRSREVKRSLFLGKRLAEDQDIEDFSPLTKKARETEERLSTCSLEVNFDAFFISLVKQSEQLFVSTVLKYFSYCNFFKKKAETSCAASFECKNFCCMSGPT